jgi:alkyl sulfatase BDS1-like metallo-beta-lactamase superfamily hydrolase
MMVAELVNQLLHNILTPRGAKVRDTAKFASDINYLIEYYGKDVEFSVGSHLNPIKGNKEILEQ